MYTEGEKNLPGNARPGLLLHAVDACMFLLKLFIIIIIFLLSLPQPNLHLNRLWIPFKMMNEEFLRLSQLDICV